MPSIFEMELIDVLIINCLTLIIAQKLSLHMQGNNRALIILIICPQESEDAASNTIGHIGHQMSIISFNGA